MLIFNINTIAPWTPFISVLTLLFQLSRWTWRLCHRCRVCHIVGNTSSRGSLSSHVAWTFGCKRCCCQHIQFLVFTQFNPAFCSNLNLSVTFRSLPHFYYDKRSRSSSSWFQRTFSSPASPPAFSYSDLQWQRPRCFCWTCDITIFTNPNIVTNFEFCRTSSRSLKSSKTTRTGRHPNTSGPVYLGKILKEHNLDYLQCYYCFN